MALKRSNTRFLGTEKTNRCTVDLGCWKDEIYDRAIKNGFHFGTKVDPMAECHDYAQGRGWTVFGVGYTVECFTAPDVGDAYKRHGPSTKCENGVGKYYVVQVYRISTCITPGNESLETMCR